MATDYISREAAIEALCKAHSPYPRRREISVRAIQEIPAADVVEVVRCKNCAFWNKEDSQPNGCLCEHWSGADALWYTPHDSFCSDGLKVVEIDQVKEWAE